MGEKDQTKTSESKAADSKTRDTLLGKGGFGWILSDAEQKSLLNYVSIGIILIEFAVTVFAVGYGIANAQTLPDGTVRFRFPWAAYIVAVILAPVAVMLIVHIIDFGFNRFIKGDPVLDKERMAHLPERMQKLISLVQGAPTVILLAGIMVLGLLLYYLDAVMTFVVRLGDSVETVALWATIGLVTAWCTSYLAKIWLMYKTRRLTEEYAFRREVLERTGIVITDATSIASDQRALSIQAAPAAMKAIDVAPSAPGPAPNPGPVTEGPLGPERVVTATVVAEVADEPGTGIPEPPAPGPGQAPHAETQAAPGK